MHSGSVSKELSAPRRVEGRRHGAVPRNLAGSTLAGAVERGIIAAMSDILKGRTAVIIADMSDDPNVENARRGAAIEWIAKLSHTSVDTSELQAFFAWRRDPDNRRIWEALEAGRRPLDRFVVRPETERYKVIDIWTGQTAIIAMTAQDDMSEEDALHTARLLNRRAKGGDRSVPQ